MIVTVDSKGFVRGRRDGGCHFLADDEYIVKKKRKARKGEEDYEQGHFDGETDERPYDFV